MPESQPPAYSFLLVNFNMAALVTQLIGKLSDAMAGDSFEIIVADNSSESGERLDCGSFAKQPNVRLIPIAENRGFVDALNRIIPKARGQWITILHPDVEISGDSIRALSDFLAAHPKAGMASPDLYYPNGEGCRIRLRSPAVRTECRRLCNVLTYIAVKRSFFPGEVFWDRSSTATVETVMSVCMMFRRAALEAAGSIDPGLTFYYANDYLCHRARRAGFSCHYVTNARAVHFERYTPRKMYSSAEVMRYKSSTVASNPRMRQDYFRFLRLCYPMWKMLVLRAVAFIDDALQFAAHFKQPKSDKAERASLWKSILIDLGSRS